MYTLSAPDVIDAAAEQARRGIADCDAKLSQHRAALDAGANSKIISKAQLAD